MPKYDFNWQTDYIFKQPLKLPKGTKLHATAWYDNSPSNKSNPDPTKDVWWGDQTWEEMMFTGLTYSIDPVAAALGRSERGRTPFTSETHGETRPGPRTGAERVRSNLHQRCTAKEHRHGPFRDDTRPTIQRLLAGRGTRHRVSPRGVRLDVRRAGDHGRDRVGRLRRRRRSSSPSPRTGCCSGA